MQHKDSVIIAESLKRIQEEAECDIRSGKIQVPMPELKNISPETVEEYVIPSVAQVIAKMRLLDSIKLN